MNFFIFFIISQASLNFYYRNPLNSLYFLHKGFLDVSQGEGIIGASYNPSSLHFGSEKELALFGSSGFKTNTSFNIPLGMDSIKGTEIPQIEIPFNLNVEDRGGLDLIGAKTKIGIIDIGISYYNEETYGANLNLDFNKSLNNLLLKVKDTLTQEDHPDIPEKVRIPLDIKMNGEFFLSSKGKGGIDASLSPLSIGGAIGFGPAALGLGLNIKKYKGKADLNYSISGSSQKLTLSLDTLVSDNLGNYWDINAYISGNFENNLFSDKIYGEFSGTQFGFLLGAQAKLPFISAGISLEYDLPFTLSGNILGEFTYIEGIESYVIDTAEIIVDTINHTISGNVTIDTIRFKYSKKEHEILRASLRFPGLIGIKAGANLNLLILNLNIAGGIDLPQGGYAFGKAYFILATGFSLGPLSTNLGSVFSWRYLKYEDFYLFTPPTVTLGIGGNMNFPYFSIYLGARTTPFAGLLSGIEEIGGSGKKFLNPFKSYALNFGIKLKI